MAEHIICLSDLESRGGATLIVRPVMPQPEAIKGTPYLDPGTGEWCMGGYYIGDTPVCEVLGHHPLGVPGDVLLGKEAWQAFAIRYDEYHGEYYDEPWDGEVLQEDLEEKLFLDFRATCTEGPAPWRSPVTMPRWAIRWRRTVVEAGVMRVHDLTYDQMVSTGAPTRGRHVVTHEPSGKAGQDFHGYEADFARYWDRRWRASSLSGKQYGDNSWCFWARVGEE